MENDLGTYFLIGPSTGDICYLINSIAGRTVCSRCFLNGQLLLMPGLHSNSSKLLQSKICLLEVPGFNDNQIKLSDDELLCLLQYMYFQALSKGLKPKGFIVNEGKPTDRMAIFGSLDRLFSICGDRCKSSTLVLARMLYKRKNDEERNTLITGKCESLGIPYVKWTISLHLLPKDDGKIVLSTLFSALNSMEPYYADWMTELEEEIKKAPKIEVTEGINITDGEESDDSEIEDMSTEQRLVSHLGYSIYFKRVHLTRSGVINASRRSLGLRYN